MNPAIFSLLLLAGIQQIEPPPPPPVKGPQTRPVTRATAPAKIDGILDDEIWKTALAIPIEYEWQPGDN
ncbi:MAG TPA: hypothetical protein PLD86_19450, partial [Vicinamibacteria bacterium]|nr:hypothetical protein [Vicinamibacteria bacterium]